MGMECQMLKLEDIKKDAQVRGIQPEEIVRIVQIEPVGDAVAQTIDYASWVTDLSDSGIVDIYLNFADRYNRNYATLDEAFEAKFKISLTDITVNESHQMIVVATELDPSTERIINYLNEFAQISINALFFAAPKYKGWPKHAKHSS